MKSLTDIRILLACLYCIGFTASFGQAVQTNPLEVMAITEGNVILNMSVNDQTQTMLKTADLQGAIAGEFTNIKKWEGKYNAYLKSVRGYAEALKAGTTLYFDGVRCFQKLMEVKRAIAENPRGIGASVALNDIMIQTSIQLVKTYSTLNKAIASGGEDNMLTGAERTEMLWLLSEELEILNSDLHKLALSIAYHNLSDIWKGVTAGMRYRDKDEIAKDAFDNWKRLARANVIISGK